MRTRIRRVLAIPVALVLGLGFTVALAVPASAAGVLTVQVDTANAIYPDSVIRWSGAHDTAGAIVAWNAIQAGGDPEGIDISPDCVDQGTGDPIAYTCTWDPGVTLAVGDWMIVGTMTEGSAQPVNNDPAAFTVAEPATIAVTSAPVHPGDAIAFGGARIAGGQISAMKLDDVLLATAPSCTGITGAAMSWACTWAPPTALSETTHTLSAVYVGSEEKSTPMQTSFDVVAAPLPPGPPDIDAAQQSTTSTAVHISGRAGLGNTVRVDEGGTELCSATVTGGGGDSGSDGTWTCTTGPLTAGRHNVTATQTDANGLTSDPTDGFPVEVAAQNTITYQVTPGGLTVGGIPLTGDGDEAMLLYQWLDSGEGWGFSNGPVQSCVVAGGEGGEGESDASIIVTAVIAEDGTATCSFDLAPGIWNPFTPDGPIDSYIVVPATPTPTVSDNGDLTAHVSGAGAPGDAVAALDASGSPLCSASVSSAGSWACDSGDLTPGAQQVHAVEQNLNAIPCSGGAIPCPVEGSGFQLDYIPGGLSADSTPVAVTIAAPTTPAPKPALRTPTWSLTITGIDLANVHPGDTFTATGSGLPAGARVTFVLHSTPVTLGSTTVAGDGTYRFDGVIPLDTVAGPHEIIATLDGTGLTTTSNIQPVTVSTAVAPVSATDTLPKAESGSGDASADATGGTRESRDQLQPEVEPNVLTDGLDSIGDVVQHPGKIPAAVAIGLVLLVLGVLPAHLLDATVAEQYERLGRRFPRLAKRPAWLERFQGWLRRAPALGGLLVTSVTAVLFCFADPRFGFNLESVRLLIALAVALFVVTYLVDAVTALIVRRAWDVAVTVSVRPLGLVLSLIGVIASRALHFSPGFLIGLVLGLSIAGTAAGRYAWRAIAIRTGLILGLAVAAWAGFSAFSHDGAEHDFTTALLLELLVAIATEGIVALMVELLPFHLLEGERVFHRSKVLWGALYLVTVVIFVVAVVPWEGNWAELGSGLWAWLGVLVAFAVIATGIYVYFRRRSHHEHEVEEDVAEQEQVPIGED